jgi:hypothetical protein
MVDRRAQLELGHSRVELNYQEADYLDKIAVWNLFKFAAPEIIHTYLDGLEDINSGHVIEFTPMEQE